MQGRWTTPAVQDLEEITLYIEKDSETAAREIASALFDAGNSLDVMSSRGRLGQAVGTRELVIPGLPYILVYKVTKAAVHILRIDHTARVRPKVQ